MCIPSPVDQLDTFDLHRLRRWVGMLSDLDGNALAVSTEVRDSRRRLLNRIIFNQCAMLSRSGMMDEVERIIAVYHNTAQVDPVF